MLNKNPLWRYLVVLGLLLLALVYALPNLYPEQPALNISASRGGELTPGLVKQLANEFDRAGLKPQALELNNGQLVVRFNSADEQLAGRELASSVLGNNYITALNLAPTTPAWLAAIGAGPMKLGLDLRGGVHFLLAVDMQAVLDKQLNDSAQQLRALLRENQIRYQSVSVDTANQQLRLSLRDNNDAAASAKLITQQLPELQQSADGLSFTLKLTEVRQKQVREEALQQNLTIIRNRVNEIGVAEPLVQRQGADRIIVQLPGVQDTALAKEILGATASLEFRLVDTEADIAAALAGRLPPNAELYYSRDGQPLLLEKRIMLTGDHINGASAGYDQYGQPKVSIKLDAQGGTKLSAATKDAVGRRMASVFIEYKPGEALTADGTPVLLKQQEVINDATIQQRLGMSFDITGIASPAEAQNLATLLRAGALIAPVQIIEERTIGPSLGQENIALGVSAIQWGLAAVMLFMLVYYKAFGMVANIALMANLVLIIGVLSMVPGATLTLPGMAGIVLTVGMAVDANVLIFERIREELSEGRSVQQAIHLGYDRAFATIADSNITTLLVALVLFGVGTGPVKGFAVTLAIGILTSIFTAVVGTRLLVNLIWGGRRLQSLPV
ncbi:protein translocase subunit SecD [Rheinheimera nanhaiensis]|uniref:Protein translocase subunit SecD n=1 Tax=Rheinheimera nanhaiensis E407-8 TaxID=562729 RepID=I1DVH6_9GAMM|nr:protein translocase subunit SecD [Rheinheimera nanhaiensis]GAB58054.1 preprotein translocase subunit SecD [Rheinheimera nanhaiensis E407-8]